MLPHCNLALYECELSREKLKKRVSAVKVRKRNICAYGVDESKKEIIDNVGKERPCIKGPRI